MAGRKQQKDVITRLAETGEEALHKLADLAGADRLADAANTLRERVDELTRRARALDPLARRVAALERRLDELTKPTAAHPRASSRSARRTTKTTPASRPQKTGGR